MAIVSPFPSSYSATLRPDSVRIGSDRLCHYCGERVGRLQPVIVFALQRPQLVGVAHPECAYFDFRYAQFGISGALTLNPFETSLLAHFYHRLFQLPGQGQPRSAQRRCLAAILLDYPHALADLPALISQFQAENQDELLDYPGDLEKDCYVFLGEVWKTSQAEPLDVYIDFG
jgi:hypothetical protein